MKAKVDYRELFSALTLLGRAVPARQIIPAQGCVLVESVEDHLRLSTTGQQLSIVMNLAADIIEEGSLCVPYAKFSDFIGNAPSALVDLEINEEKRTCVVSGESGRASIKGIAAIEFPKLPPLPAGILFSYMQSDLLRKTVELVAFSAASEEAARTMPASGCVYVQANSEGLSAVATDSYRLGHARHKTVVEGVNMTSLVQAKTLLNVCKSLPDDQLIEIHQDDGRLFLFWEGTLIVMQETVSNYPDVTSELVPKEGSHKIVVDRGSLRRALAATSSFLPPMGTVDVTIDKDGLVLSTIAEGDRSRLPVFTLEATDEEVVTHVSHSMLSDVVRALSKDEVVIHYMVNTQQMLIKEETDDLSLSYIIMTRSF